MNFLKKYLKKTHCCKWDICYRKFHCGKCNKLLLVKISKGLNIVLCSDAIYLFQMVCRHEIVSRNLTLIKISLNIDNFPSIQMWHLMNVKTSMKKNLIYMVNCEERGTEERERWRERENTWLILKPT